jgi:hypothetical protein
MSSAMIAVPHIAELPPRPPKNLTFSNDNSDDDHRQQKGKNIYCDPKFEVRCFSPEPHFLTQRDRNHPVRDLNLSKNKPTSRFQTKSVESSPK